MKTCMSRNIDIQYWQNIPNGYILYQYNKTVSHERKTRYVETWVLEVLLYTSRFFWTAQSEIAPLNPMGLLADSWGIHCRICGCYLYE